MSRPAGNGSTRAALGLRDGWTCCWCGVNVFGGVGDQAPTVEHVVPRSKGGTNALENLKLACNWCNAHRKDSAGPPPLRSDPPPASRVHLRLTTKRNPIADACVVCGGSSPDSLYCERHRAGWTTRGTA